MTTEIVQAGTPPPGPGGPLPTPAEAASLAPSPEQAIDYARRCAQALATVLDPAGMTIAVGGDRRHVRVEGWQTLGAMTGHSARVVWCREYSDADRGDGWEARAEVVDGAGRVVGAGEGMCLRTEKRWRDADEYAIRSMAQTRAISRSLSSVLRHVIVLAGYEGTPAEEMPAEDPGPRGRRGRRETAQDRLDADARRLAEKRRRWESLRGQGLDDSDLAALLTGNGIPNSDALLEDATFQRAQDLVREAAEALARDERPAPAADAASATDRTAGDGAASTTKGTADAAPPEDGDQDQGDGSPEADDDARGPYSDGDHA